MRKARLIPWQKLGFIAWLAVTLIPLAGCSGQPSAASRPLADCVADTVPEHPRFAVVIGEADYPKIKSYVGQAWTSLPVARRDAAAMAEVLTCRGYKLTGNGPQYDLTRSQIRAELIKLSQQAAEKNAIIAVYISSHGLRWGSKTTIVPVDTSHPIPGIVDDPDSYISVQEIDETLHAGRPLLSLIILDTCRDAPPSTDPLDGRTDRISPETVLGLATEPGAEALAPENQENSLFTASLRTVLADNDTGGSVRSVFEKASYAVSRRTDWPQNPVYLFGDAGKYADFPADLILGSGRSSRRGSQSERAVSRDPLESTVEFSRLDLQCDKSKNYLDASTAGDSATGNQADADKLDKCRAIARQLNADGLRPDGSPAFQQELTNRLKQAAEQGNPKANLYVWMAGNSNAIWAIGWNKQAVGALSPQRRTELEYLDRAADGGEPLAMLFAGRLRAPHYDGTGSYFSVLPEGFDDLFAKGRKYLEGALNAGIADAGWMLADISISGIDEFPTERERFREYSEKALKATPWAMEESAINLGRYKLAYDYMNTVPADRDRALELYRDVFKSPDDALSSGYSIRGLAAWEIGVTEHSRSRRSDDPAKAAEMRTWMTAAADLNIREAMVFVGGCMLDGSEGFQKDPGRGSEYLRRAKSLKSYTSE